MQLNTTPSEKPMQTIDMMVDLSGKEIIAIYALALVGMATMSQDIENTILAIGQMDDLDVDPVDAKSAMKKLKSGIRLSVVAMAQEEVS